MAESAQSVPMTDEIPENFDLRLIALQNAQILRELAAIRTRLNIAPEDNQKPQSGLESLSDEQLDTELATLLKKPADVNP
jgi:hypothetical protein